MATTTSNGSTNFPSPGSIVCLYQTNLRAARAASAGKREASAALIHAWEIARGYKLCTLSKTEETYAFYQALENYELFDAQQSTDTISTDVTGYSKDDNDLGTALANGAKQLNDLKAKSMDANNAACAMRNCLQSVLGFADDAVPDELKAVIEATKSISDKSQKAADAMVTIAGIHTFANISSLQPHADALFAALKDLMTTADGCIKKASDDATAAQKDLTALLDELNTEEFNSCEEFSNWKSLDTMIDFICEGECEPIGCVGEMCLQVSACEGGPGAAAAQSKPAKYTTGDRD